MRITVRRVVELIGVYANGEELLRDYPHPQAEDLRQALNFALAHLDGTIDLYLDAACVFCRIRVSRLKPHARRLEMDAAHVREPDMSHSSDAEILLRAIPDDRICVTLDEDFHEVLALTGAMRPWLYFRGGRGYRPPG